MPENIKKMINTIKKINLFLAVILFILVSCGQSDNSDNSDNSKFDKIALRWVDVRKGTPDITTAMKDACDWEKINRNNLNGSFRIDDSIMGGPFNRIEMYDKIDAIMRDLKKSMSNLYKCN